ncbi:MAG: hypothetical protein Q9178_007886 [Gyalolechia marmorata]
MAKKAKSRTISVRLISMALTGYYRTLRRPRAHTPLSMMKYDPVGTSFPFSVVEEKRGNVYAGCKEEEEEGRAMVGW